MTPETHPDDLLGAFALDCCPEPEAASVAAHAAECARCARQIERLADAAHWIGAVQVERPPAALRQRVLAAARTARPTHSPAPAEALAPYVVQVVAFGRLLADLSESQWDGPTMAGGTVRELVTHLTANDEMVAADLGADLPAPSADAGRRWQEQADGLLRTVADADDPVLARAVRLAGATPLRRPLREALTQRAFETWIHAEDIRGTLRLPPESPPPEHLARIVAFGLGLLPTAMDAAGRGRSGQAVRLALAGPGGGEHVVPLSARGSGSAAVIAAVTLTADRYCRLMAGRITASPRNVHVTGDELAAADFLAVASTLGCD